MSNNDRNNRKPFQGLYPNQQRHNERQPLDTNDAHREDTHKHHLGHHLRIDTTNLDPGRLRPHHKHRHSKSRERRVPRTMSHIASSAGARGLLPTWSAGSKEKDREDDDGLLRPVTQDTSRMRWGSVSTSGVGGGSRSRSRRGSFLEGVEQNDRIGPPRQDIRSMEDLEQVKNRRKQGEEYLRTALVSIGTLATDTTRRLDYTYYNLLEKVTALNTTITSFQGLTQSTAMIHEEFQREVASMDQEIRKQVGELGDFQAQLEKIEDLEGRMKQSRKRAEGLENRLETMRKEIDDWEKRETAWQTRVGRRLRILWGIIGMAVLAFVVAVIIQNWPLVDSPEPGMRATTVANGSSKATPNLSGRNESSKWLRHSSKDYQPSWQSATGPAKSQNADASAY